MSEDDWDNRIYCAGCGQALHIKGKGLYPEVYGWQVHWIKCDMCDWEGQLKIVVKRLEPDLKALFIRHTEREFKKK